MIWRLAALLLCLSVPGAAQSRKALLIGNGGYRHLTPIENSVSGVRRLAASIARAGFLVQTAEDAGIERLDQEMGRFSQSLRPGDVALFYYSGYGVEQEGENYLLPVDFRPEADVSSAAYSATRVMETNIAGRQVSLAMLIFDAARQESALARRFHDPGLALMETSRPGVLIAFSAGPRQFVRNSAAFNEALVSAIAKPGLALSQVFEEVKRAVSASTSGEQIPAYVSSVVSDFRFFDPPSDRENWDRVKASADRRPLEEFRRQFPNSPFAADALKRVEQLEARERAGLQQQERLARLAEGRRLVAEAMERYAGAYRQRDLSKLREIWPGMGRERASALQEFFRANKSIEFEVTPAAEPQLEGDSATLRCDQNIRIPGGKPIRTSVDIRFKKSGSALLIDSITVIK